MIRSMWTDRGIFITKDMDTLFSMFEAFVSESNRIEDLEEMNIFIDNFIERSLSLVAAVKAMGMLTLLEQLEARELSWALGEE